MRLRVFAAFLQLLLLVSFAEVPSLGAHENPRAQEQDETEYDGPAFEDEFVLEGVGPGRCFPEVAVAGSTVDCTFPIIGRVQELAEWQGALTLSRSTDWEGEEQPGCRVGDGQVWCPHANVDYAFGQVDVSLELAGNTRLLASYEAVDPFEHDYSMSLFGGDEPIVFEQRPLRVSVWRNDLDSDASAFAMVRRRVDSRTYGAFVDPFETVAIEALDAPEPGSYVGVETAVDLDEFDLEPGRYVAMLCIGPSAAECSVVPGTYAFQVIDPTLRELVPGHNRIDAARINLVFVGSNVPADESLPELARSLLTIGGPYVVDFDGGISPLTDETSAQDVVQVAFGPFAIEPLRSAVDRFNLWYIADDVVDEYSLFHNSDPEFSSGHDLDGFELPNTSIVTLHHQDPGAFARSQAWWTSFRGRTDVPARDEMQFAGAYVAFDAKNPMWASTTLAHELGHSLFDLRDEYTEFDRATEFGFPNCADSPAQAEQWWGERIGDVDPFVHEYAQFLQGVDFWVPDTLIEDVTVGLVDGGCYGGSAAAYRPTVDSIMNSEVPVFGAVNRARVEDLLGQFVGRVQLQSHDDLALRCFPATAAEPGEAVRCGGQLARFVDAQDGAIELSMAGQVVACSIDRVDDIGVRGVSCPELKTTGDGPWTVVVSIDDGLGEVVARLESSVTEEAQSESTTTTSTTEAVTNEGEPDNPVAGGGSYDGTVVLWSGVAALLVIGVGGWLFSRSNQRARERSAAKRDDSPPIDD